MPDVAVVTGGSRGIGAATAVLLAHRGWAMCIGYRSNAAAARQVIDACKGSGRATVAVEADLSSAAGVAELFAAVDELGRIGVLVNNAGIVDHKARVDEMTEERIERMLHFNVLGPLLCSGAAVRRMSVRHGGTGGVIVNVSSVAARLGSPGEYVDHAASKGALDTLLS